MNKKVLLVIDNLGSGGAQNQMTLLALELDKSDYEVTIYTYHPQDFFASRISNTGIKHVRGEKKGKFSISIIRQLTRLIDEYKFDVAISYMDTPNLYLCLASKFSKHHPKIFISYRTKTDFTRLSFLKLKQKEWVNKVADGIISNSNHERERWQKKYPKLKDKWVTIYNMVDLDKFVFHQKSKKSAPLRLMAVGKVRPLKNADVLIEALFYLKQKGMSLPEVDWYGGRDFKQVDFRNSVKAIEKKIAEYNLSAHIKWFDPVNNLHELMPEYDALIHPSLWEGLPNAICEALSAGLPVLASNILDHPVLVKDQERGFLFDPNDPEELANAIIKMQEMNEDEYDAMRKNCRSYAESSFLKSTRLAAYEKQFHG